MTPAGDVDSLVRALITLADSPDKRKKMGGNARKLLESYYAKDVVLEKFRQEIESIVS